MGPDLLWLFKVCADFNEQHASEPHLYTQRDTLITEEQRTETSSGDGDPGWDGVWAFMWHYILACGAKAGYQRTTRFGPTRLEVTAQLRLTAIAFIQRQIIPRAHLRIASRDAFSPLELERGWRASPEFARVLRHKRWVKKSDRERATACD